MSSNNNNTGHESTNDNIIGQEEDFQEKEADLKDPID
jgi:hypothetical protein